MSFVSHSITSPMFFIHIGCFVPTDFTPEDWGPEHPLCSPSKYPVPMPTLYSTEGYKFKKPSVIEMLLYNMAALLGGVAAGYDLRMSNVSPLHPRLQPYRAETENESLSVQSYEGVTYSHNTYHGPARHTRSPLNAITGPSLSLPEQKPIRFTDSQLGASTSSHSHTHTQSHTLAHSGTSGLGTSSSPRRGSTSDQLADLCFNYREHFQDRDYYRPEYNYDRTVDYVVKHGVRYGGYDECNFEYPSSEFPRPPTYLTHRRTPSNSSASNPHTEEFSPSRHYARPTKKPIEYSRKSDYSLPPPPQPYFSRQNSLERTEIERPANLGLEPTKLRSSLKKYNKKSGSGGGTPTNPTPPDSLTSDTDLSYVSARDTSSGSQSRVRFSPETMDGHIPERRPSRHS